MITEDYVSFETAKLLKEKGFNEDSWFHYDTDGDIVTRGYRLNHPDDVPAWTLQTARKWLRKVHNIDIVIDAAVGMLGVKVYVPFISTYKPLKNEPSKVYQFKRGICYKNDKGIVPALQQFESYEEAIEAAIKYCLENLI